MGYWTGKHTRHRLKYHLVWVPKYRKRVLRGKIAAHLKKLFYECATVNGWKIEELAVNEDHVHLLMQIGPQESVAWVVQMLKGGTSRILREKYKEELEEFLWGDNFWAEGYFAETVGVVQEAMIERYMREQRAL